MTTSNENLRIWGNLNQFSGQGPVVPRVDTGYPSDKSLSSGVMLIKKLHYPLDRDLSNG